MNDIVLKIQNGTQRGDTDLCRTCAHAQFVRDTKGEIRICNMMDDGNPRGPVTQCTEYCNRTLPSLRAMSEIAWNIRVDRKTREVGFAAPKPQARDIEDL